MFFFFFVKYLLMLWKFQKLKKIFQISSLFLPETRATSLSQLPKTATNRPASEVTTGEGDSTSRRRLFCGVMWWGRRTSSWVIHSKSPSVSLLLAGEVEFFFFCSICGSCTGKIVFRISSWIRGDSVVPDLVEDLKNWVFKLVLERRNWHSKLLR